MQPAMTTHPQTLGQPLVPLHNHTLYQSMDASAIGRYLRRARDSLTLHDVLLQQEMGRGVSLLDRRHR